MTNNENSLSRILHCGNREMAIHLGQFEGRDSDITEASRNWGQCMHFSVDEKSLAASARQRANGREVLYHGTRHAKKILIDMEMRFSDVGEQVICLTRSPEVAAYWALLERDDDEGRGCIFILDRRSLRCRYRVEPWDPVEGPNHNDEMEERIWGRDVYDLWRHLIGMVWQRNRREPRRRRRRRGRAVARLIA